MLNLFFLALSLPALSLAQTFSIKPYNETAAFIFAHTDVNHDGIMDRNELDLGFRHYDANLDGRVTYNEFTTFVQAQGHDPHTTHLLHALYRAYDENKDNNVDHLDFDIIFALSDYNNDGRVDRAEFIRYMSIVLETIDESV
ncbi:polcalcin Bra n 2 [Biomphalaria pfeifferi]|uniref:Polcalcin Bra n 2 n=1 Tax=Biomphalaria pfeifferi TaxID=112525 RepID=A0AAD8EYW8_BIOPF|nr:polcalcin Bra n 2 [Biomphalaria pfeifferi]